MRLILSTVGRICCMVFTTRVVARDPSTMLRIAMFKGREFDQSVILLCVRWYLAYNLSLRDLQDVRSSP